MAMTGDRFDQVATASAESDARRAHRQPIAASPGSPFPVPGPSLLCLTYADGLAWEGEFGALLDRVVLAEE